MESYLAIYRGFVMCCVIAYLFGLYTPIVAWMLIGGGVVGMIMQLNRLLEKHFGTKQTP